MNKEKRDELKRLCEELKNLPMIAKGLDAIGEPIFRQAIPELLAQVDELEAKVEKYELQLKKISVGDVFFTNQSEDVTYQEVYYYQRAAEEALADDASEKPK